MYKNIKWNILGLLLFTVIINYYKSFWMRLQCQKKYINYNVEYNDTNNIHLFGENMSIILFHLHLNGGMFLKLDETNFLKRN
ncbi:hypothetical protein MBFIL_04830 [Methanobrevibacter filiformis]|uniref:Uncharacterized protein n=1 Tax=Methanobrevibacter filiformis TaxID=55758 RepID=A0A166EI05_9EURY|nr:hypothetical protein MBFIL_04830 [Methanobrevibacter filiformis]